MHAQHGILDAHRQRQQGNHNMTGEIVGVGFGDACQCGGRNDYTPFDRKADPSLPQPPGRAQQTAADQRAQDEATMAGM